MLQSCFWVDKLACRWREILAHSFALYIFDLDGTLVDSLKDLACAVNRVLEVMGCPQLPEQQIHGYVGQGARWLLEESLKAAGTTSDRLEEARGHFLPIYSEQLTTHTHFFPQALETIDTLSKNGARVALCTNKPYELTEKLLKHLGAWERFEIILGGDSLPTKKPDPAPLVHIMQHCGVSADNTLMIGDSTFDIIAGKAAGTATCAVTFGNHDKNTLQDEHPDFMIEQLSQILSL